MSKESLVDKIMFVMSTVQNGEAPLIQYENTKDVSLLPKIKSVKADYERAIDTWLSLLHTVDNSHPKRPFLLTGLAITYRMLGMAHYCLSEYDDAKNCFESALDLHDELGQKEGIVKSLNNLGMIARQQDNPSEAVRLFRLAIDRLDSKTDLEFGNNLRKNLKIAETEAQRQKLSSDRNRK